MLAFYKDIYVEMSILSCQSSAANYKNYFGCLKAKAVNLPLKKVGDLKTHDRDFILFFFSKGPTKFRTQVFP